MNTKPTRFAPITALGALLAVVTLLMASAANACTKPPSNIEIPDGQAASEDEMLTTQVAVNKYLDEMNAYLECLDARMQELPDDQAGERARFINGARYTAALDEMQELAEKFNMQVRVFRLRSERPQ